MASLNEPRLRRKPSILSLFTSAPSRRFDTVALQSALPHTPQAVRRHTSGDMRRLLMKVHRDHEPEFTTSTSPSSPPTTPSSPPQITKLTKAFADALTAQKLSNLLTWMLFHDVVQLPESPESWYEPIEPMEMRGWIALGRYLATRDESGYGLDLIVLDSICDRININRKTVHAMLIQFANPAKMAYSHIAITFQDAETNGSTQLEALEAVHAKLRELQKLAVRLKPKEGSSFKSRHDMVLKRIPDFLHLVLGPRIKHRRSGAPLVTSTTSDQMPEEIRQGIKLNYMFEVMQQERTVPLARYGIYSNSAISTPFTTNITLANDASSETDRAHILSMDELMTENQTLQSQVADLQYRNDKLLASNEKLAQRISRLGRGQPVGYLRQTPSDVTLLTASASIPSSPPGQLQAPTRDSTHLRSVLRHDTQTTTAIALGTDAGTLQRQHVEDLANKYGTIFDGLAVIPPASCSQAPERERLTEPSSAVTMHTPTISSHGGTQ